MPCHVRLVQTIHEHLLRAKVCTGWSLCFGFVFCGASETLYSLPGIIHIHELPELGNRKGQLSSALAHHITLRKVRRLRMQTKPMIGGALVLKEIQSYRRS